MTRPERLAVVVAATAAGLYLVRRKDEGAAENTYGLPDGAGIREALAVWFGRQAARVLGTLDTIGVELPAHFPPLTDYDDPMARAMTPLIGAYWDQGGREVRERVGLDPDAWSVVNPYTEAKIRGAALTFCVETNATTSLHLNDALNALRTELVEGIVEQGDTLKQLRKRVEGVFDHAEKYRAQRIAATEASRAVHAAQLESAQESGVVAGLEWLVSGDACPLCQMVATEARQVRLGHAFAEVGHHPQYSTIRHPPLHPGCQCTALEVLKPEYGGPDDPEWSPPLIQPKPGPEYEPPEGQAVPKPAPQRANDREPKRYLIPELPRVAFVQPPGARDNAERVVWIDTDKFDHAWATEDAEFYVAPGGHAGGKPGAYDEARRFLTQTAPNEGVPVELGRAGLGKHGVYWIDGRHRFAVLRDMGIGRVPLSVDRHEADAFHDRFS